MSNRKLRAAVIDGLGVHRGHARAEVYSLAAQNHVTVAAEPGAVSEDRVGLMEFQLFSCL